MNQQTLQKIYKTYQTQEYYNRYFKQLKLREDSRQFSQNRDIKINISNGTVAVSKGQTIVITQLSTKVQKVIYNSVDKNYGKSLLSIFSNIIKGLNVKLPSFKGSYTKQNRSSSSIEQFISNKISWRNIQNQLVIKQSGNRYYAHVGQIQVRIVSNDGCLNEISLLAVQLLLWSYKFKKIDTQTASFKEEFFLLQIQQFYYPCKYCQIMDQVLIDPTLTQQQNSSFVVSLIGDLLSGKIDENYFMIQKLGKNCDKIQKQIMNSIIQMWKIQMSKLTFDIKQLKTRISSLENQQNSLDLIIKQ